VFLAMLIVCLSFACYSSDMDAYVRLQDRLKLLAEDCAAGAALAVDAEAYSRGLLVIDETGARRVCELLLEKASGVPMFSGGSLSYELRVFDDDKGYSGCAGYGFAPGLPAAVVTLRFDCGDLFRLQFLELRSAVRTASYQWDDSLTF